LSDLKQGKLITGRHLVRKRNPSSREPALYIFPSYLSVASSCLSPVIAPGDLRPGAKGCPVHRAQPKEEADDAAEAQGQTTRARWQGGGTCLACPPAGDLPSYRSIGNQDPSGPELRAPADPRPLSWQSWVECREGGGTAAAEIPRALDINFKYTIKSVASSSWSETA
jgi:hypothetical protein